MDSFQVQELLSACKADTKSPTLHESAKSALLLPKNVLEEFSSGAASSYAAYDRVIDLVLVMVEELVSQAMLKQLLVTSEHQMDCLSVLNYTPNSALVTSPSLDSVG